MSFNKLNELAQRLEANEARQDTGPKVVQALDLKDQSLVNLQDRTELIQKPTKIGMSPNKLIEGSELGSTNKARQETGPKVVQVLD